MQMAPVCDPVSLTAAFAVGMAGSVHCLAMCGGISGALGLRARQAPNRLRAALATAAHQAGRLTGYAFAGGIVGAFGGLLQGFFHPQLLVLLARLAAGVVLLVVGSGILFRWRPAAILERFGGRLWRRLAPLARSIPPGGIPGALLLGMLWGWLPCGFVYSMLIFAALKGGALQAATLMLSFGLGTTPALLGLGLVTTQAARLGWARGLNTAAGCLLLVFGAATIIAPWTHVMH